MSDVRCAMSDEWRGSAHCSPRPSAMSDVRRMTTHRSSRRLRRVGGPDEHCRGRRANAGWTRCPPGVRRRRLRQLPRHERAHRHRRTVRRGAPREQRSDDGRRVRPHERHGHRGVGAPGMWPDERDDRHHRGGEEPHTAARPRRRGDVAAVELPRRPTGAGRRRRRRVDACDVPCVGRERSRDGVLDGAPRPAHRPAQPSTRRASRRGSGGRDDVS